MSEEELSNPKDDSRPAFPRPSGCMGIYLDAMDARPDKQTTVGSHHAFMMAVMDKMMEYLKTLDLAVVKGNMEHRHVGDGVILEGFKFGCVLAVSFDTPEAVEKLWELHQRNRMSHVFQDMLVNRALLKATGTVKLTLRAKLWQDEYDACLQEVQQRSPARQKLSSFERDLAMVQRIKKHQKGMTDTIAAAREKESQFEHSLGEFMLTIKRVVPTNTTVIRTVKEFSTNMKMAKGINGTSFKTIDQYLATLEFFKKLFTEVETDIVFPLYQVRALVENEKQRALKKTIKSACAEVLAALKPETDLQKVRFQDWSRKVLQREQGLFYGLISLIPLAFDRLTTIDVSADEYVMDFAEMSS